MVVYILFGSALKGNSIKFAAKGAGSGFLTGAVTGALGGDGAIYGGISPGSVVTKFVTNAVGDASAQYIENGGNNSCINFGQVIAAGVLGVVAPSIPANSGLAGADLFSGAVSGKLASSVGNPF